MRSRLFHAAAQVSIAVALASCGAPPPSRTPTERVADSAAALTALQKSEFGEARVAAEAALARDPRNARAAAVHAIARYQAAGEQLYRDLELLMHDADLTKLLDHEEGRAMWQRFADTLAAIDGDLEVAAADPEFSLELCLACWEHDWNHNGHVDERDRKLFEIEYEPRCAPDAPDCRDELPDGDPRRRPTFRFDRGDADWARAMIGFQRGLVELVLAYRWNDLDQLFGHKAPVMTIRLADGKRVAHARELFAAALGYSERSREEYLAETDDDREWVPNPNQKSHPIPLPMDAAIYDTWKGVVGDLQRLLASQDGISFRAVAAMVDKDIALYVPDAYLDLGAMLRAPKDFVIDLKSFDDGTYVERANPETMRPKVERVLQGLFGNGYVKSMRPSPILERIERMKQELASGHEHGETLERKLRYLFWIN